VYALLLEGFVHGCESELKFYKLTLNFPILLLNNAN
jgi:hypothetical protein